MVARILHQQARHRQPESEDVVPSARGQFSLIRAVKTLTWHPGPEGPGNLLDTHLRPSRAGWPVRLRKSGLGHLAGPPLTPSPGLQGR